MADEYETCGFNCEKYRATNQLEGDCEELGKVVRLGERCHMGHKKPKFDDKTQSFLDLIDRCSP